MMNYSMNLLNKNKTCENTSIFSTERTLERESMKRINDFQLCENFDPKKHSEHSPGIGVENSELRPKDNLKGILHCLTIKKKFPLVICTNHNCQNIECPNHPRNFTKNRGGKYEA